MKTIEERAEKKCRQYRVWADSESAVDVPGNIELCFDDINEAYSLAANLAHEHDGKKYRAIFHVEDMDIEETVDTVENEVSDDFRRAPGALC